MVVDLGKLGYFPGDGGNSVPVILQRAFGSCKLFCLAATWISLGVLILCYMLIIVLHVEQYILPDRDLRIVPINLQKKHLVNSIKC